MMAASSRKKKEKEKGKVFEFPAILQTRLLTDVYLHLLGEKGMKHLRIYIYISSLEI